MIRRYWKAALAVILVAAVGCDCEDRARSLIYGSSDDTPVTPLGDQDEEREELREVEPNDSRDQAMPISLSSDTRPVHAAIDPADDVDWFVLEVDDDETWMVELTVEPKDSELDLAIYLDVRGDSDHAPLMYDVAGAGEAETIPMLGVTNTESRPFFVTGADDSTTGEYRVDVRRRLSAATVAMAPNDYPHLAMTLPVPGEVQGFYDRPHDRDVFYVPAEALQAGVYTLEVSAIAGLTQNLRIYGDKELDSPLMEIPVTDREPAVIPNLSLSAERGEGLYFVLSAGEDFNREQGYRLRVIEHPESDDYVLEREPNDTEGTAQVVDFDEPLRGYLHSPGDVDRFRFVIDDSDGEDEEDDDAQDERETSEVFDPTIEDDEEDEESEFDDPWEAVADKERPEYVVQAHLRPLGDAHRLAMRWLPGEDSGQEERELRADGNEEEITVCNKVLGPGEYDLEVRSVETDEGFRPRGYDYELEIVNVAGLEGLEIEPNDSPENADRLPMGTERSGFIATEGDTDIFAFIVGPDEPRALEEETGDEADDEEGESPTLSAGWEAPESEKVRISLDGNHLNLGFQLLDDEGGRVARVNESGPGGDEELNIDLPHGLYYVAVSASAGSLCEPYTIRVDER